jgi:hypothetical protein
MLVRMYDAPYKAERLLLIPAGVLVLSCIAGAVWERKTGRTVGAGLMVVCMAVILVFLMYAFVALVGFTQLGDYIRGP